ncbi:hypothetical protein [Halobacterium jilantaiense]|nr:hypothetical protein [Halobacterium jilantaiense]
MNASRRTTASVALQFLSYSIVATGVYYVFSDASPRGAVSLGLAAGITVTAVVYWLGSRE